MYGVDDVFVSHTDTLPTGVIATILLGISNTTAMCTSDINDGKKNDDGDDGTTESSSTKKRRLTSQHDACDTDTASCNTSIAAEPVSSSSMVISAGEMNHGAYASVRLGTGGGSDKAHSWLSRCGDWAIIPRNTHVYHITHFTTC